MNGLAGSFLRINLRTRDVKRSPADETFAKEWLGARGFVSKILYDEVPLDADPLGPQNKVVVAPGILTGTFVPAGSKCGLGQLPGDKCRGGFIHGWTFRARTQSRGL